MISNIDNNANTTSNKTKITKEHDFGIIDFLVANLKKTGVDKEIDDAFNKDGHKPDIPYGIIGLIFIANIIASRSPLYKIAEMFKPSSSRPNRIFDFKGTFGMDILPEQLNDDRFGKFLDRFHEVGCRELFIKIMVHALQEHGIELTNISYDTTTKTMWGAYEYVENEEQSSLKITRGYNKQKRHDKNQIVIGLGTSGSFIVDGVVLSGNTSDTTYNSDNLDYFEKFKNGGFGIDTRSIYTADSSFASIENFRKANGLGVTFLTRIPDNWDLTKNEFTAAMGDLNSGKTVHAKNANGEIRKFLAFENIGTHEDFTLKTCVYYSEAMLPLKIKTLEKADEKERLKVSKSTDKANKAALYSCEADAIKAQKKFLETNQKLKFYHLTSKIEEVKTCAPGKKPKDETKQKYTIKYRVTYEYKERPDLDMVYSKHLRKECMFMLATNDMSKTAEEMIAQYKNQSNTEVKFDQLKNDYCADSLYLKNPKRVEALMYLILIGLQTCSVIEYCVRKGLKEDGAFIYGAENRKDYNPTSMTIIEKFKDVGRDIEIEEEEENRKLVSELSDDLKKVLRYLGLKTENLSHPSGEERDKTQPNT